MLPVNFNSKIGVTTQNMNRHRLIDHSAHDLGPYASVKYLFVAFSC